MSKFIDLTGLRFGRLTVISIAGKNKHGLILWNVLCDCGNKKVVTSSALRNGNTKSCGCLKHELLFVDRIDKRYGRLFVFKYIGKDRWDSLWLCVCDCGKETVVRGSALTTGNTTSCGCYNKEQSHKKHFKDLTNMTFNQLRVINLYKIERGKTLWNCVCDCGTTSVVDGASLKNGAIKSCGCLSGESFIASELKKYFIKNYNAIKEYKKLKNPNTEFWLPYDIYLPNEKIFIEVNGLQHYEFSKHWHRNKEQFEYNKKLDRMKRKYARQNGAYVEIDLRKIKTPEEAIVYIENKIKENAN